jgi:hypothetical protein
MKSYNVKYSVKRNCKGCGDNEKSYFMILDTEVQAESEDDARRQVLEKSNVSEIKNIFEL